MTILDLSFSDGGTPCEFRIDIDLELESFRAITSFLRRGSAYEPDVSQIFMRSVKPGDTVIDVGGNVGFFTLMAAALVGPTGRVITFEPAEINLPHLRRNIEINGFSQVTVIEKAASNKAGPVKLYLSDNSNGGNALWDHETLFNIVPCKVVEIEATTIDAEAARLGLSNIKLIKTDTEGADQAVLEGAAGVLGRAAVPFVISELHEPGLAAMGHSQASFRQMMAAHGYDTFALRENGTLPHLIPLPTNLRGPHLLNVVFSTPAAVGSHWSDHLHHP